MKYTKQILIIVVAILTLQNAFVDSRRMSMKKSSKKMKFSSSDPIATLYQQSIFNEELDIIENNVECFSMFVLGFFSAWNKNVHRETISVYNKIIKNEKCSYEKLMKEYAGAKEVERTGVKDILSKLNRENKTVEEITAQCEQLKKEKIEEADKELEHYNNLLTNEQNDKRNLERVVKDAKTNNGIIIDEYDTDITSIVEGRKALSKFNCKKYAKDSKKDYKTSILQKVLLYYRLAKTFKQCSVVDGVDLMKEALLPAKKTMKERGIHLLINILTFGIYGGAKGLFYFGKSIYHITKAVREAQKAKLFGLNTAARHKYNKEAAYYTGKVFGYFFRIIPTVVLGATRRRF